jgi:hypothetical protein
VTDATHTRRRRIYLWLVHYDHNEMEDVNYFPTLFTVNDDDDDEKTLCSFRKKYQIVHLM